MGYVTSEQLRRAREIPVLSYLQVHEGENLKPIGSGYRLNDHDSLSVSEKGWYWHSRNIGSWSALDYLTDVRGYSLVEAVSFLLNETPERYHQPRPVPLLKEKIVQAKELILPMRNKDNHRITAYLQSRGIDRDLILNCINTGILYESKYYHNCVFLGKDENGKTKFAAMRSITTTFMRDAEGADKRYGFTLPPTNPNSPVVALYESPIDSLSHQTLCKIGQLPPFDGWRLSLGGVSTLALEHFLTQRPRIQHCIICTDADTAGNMVATKISNIKGITSERSPPIYGSDWNDTLQAIKKLEHTKSNTRASPQRGGNYL